MKVILTPDMAEELFRNEGQIKSQNGPYRPQFDPNTKSYKSVIKCWPLKQFKGKFIQEREVIPGMESEVDDIAFAKIEGNKISYKENKIRWRPCFDPIKKTMEPDIYMDNYSLLIYTPNFDNNTIFLTAPALDLLFHKLEEYRIVDSLDFQKRLENKTPWLEFFMKNLDDWFFKYTGICTYVFFDSTSVVKVGKWTNPVLW